MTKPPICCSRCQNPFPTGKDELAGPIPSESSDTYTPAPSVSCILTPALPLAPPLAPTLAINSTVRYSKTNL